MTRAFFPGSFDPITNGHLAFIKRACLLFDEVIVGVMTNPYKKYLFSTKERVELVEKSVEHIGNVSVKSFDNQLTVQVAKEIKADILIRGLRSVSDYHYEQEMAQINFQQSNIETLFLQATPDMQYVSSSMVRELWRFKGDYQQYIPSIVAQYMEKKKVNE